MPVGVKMGERPGWSDRDLIIITNCITCVYHLSNSEKHNCIQSEEDQVRCHDFHFYDHYIVRSSGNQGSRRQFWASCLL